MKTTFTMRERFGALVAFATVAEERSFTRAARRLQVSASAVSQSVRRLETAVGVPLLTRTSRRVEVTDAGARLLGVAAPALGELDAALRSAASEGDAVTGTLRMTVPTIASHIVPPILERYLSAHPNASVFVSIEDRKVDLVEQRYDVGIRLEEAIGPDMVAVRISGPFRFVVVAAPSYLAARGTPRKLEDLKRHDGIGLRLPTAERRYRWELERRGRTVRVDVRSRVVVSGISFAIQVARAGLGLAYVDEPSAHAAIASGELVVVLDRFAAHVPGFFLYYPQTARRSPQIRALVRAARRPPP